MQIWRDGRRYTMVEQLERMMIVSSFYHCPPELTCDERWLCLAAVKAIFFLA